MANQGTNDRKDRSGGGDVTKAEEVQVTVPKTQSTGIGHEKKD
jgi:hypothetical protein